MIICGIVGLKNSGKTFISQKLINYFTKKNFRVASIKHAHHNFDIDQSGTDSFLHRKAGSQQVIISSSKRWAKIEELKDSNEKNLVDLLGELNSPDIVIIEGYKNEKHKKIEIINEESKDYLFLKLKNVIGIVSDKMIETKITQFKRKEIENICKHILRIKTNE